MTLKAILVDPANFHEIIESPEVMVAKYNDTAKIRDQISVEDQNDLNEMFLEAGLLEELSIH